MLKHISLKETSAFKEIFRKMASKVLRCQVKDTRNFNFSKQGQGNGETMGNALYEATKPHRGFGKTKQSQS